MLLETGLPLFLAGETYTERRNDITMFVHGSNVDGVFSHVNLFVQCDIGEGNVLDRHLPMFLRRRPSGFCPLFLYGQGESDSLSMDLYVCGASHALASTTLVIPEVVGFSERATTLYVNGF